MFSERDAYSWVFDHGYYPLKEHTTDHYYRFRLSEPNPRARYVTKEITPGIKFILST
jgi:hypothetical protein